jgi:single-strand DNA-binding protein
VDVRRRAPATSIDDVRQEAAPEGDISMHDTQVTVVGNLVADPRFGTTKEGHPVASFRLASTARRFDRGVGEWRDGETLFANVTCWRGLAENVVASLKKGCAVIVLGRLNVRPWETKDGDKRESVDIDALAVGSELSRVVTIIKRAERGVVAGTTSESAEVPAGEAEPASDLDPADVGSIAGEVPADEWTPSDDAAAEPPEGAGELPVATPDLVPSGGRWRSRGAQT